MSLSSAIQRDEEPPSPVFQQDRLKLLQARQHGAVSPSEKRAERRVRQAGGFIKVIQTT
jgi:hypothetical protein